MFPLYRPRIVAHEGNVDDDPLHDLATAGRAVTCLIKEEVAARVPAAFQQAVADRFRVIEVHGPLIDRPPKDKAARTHQPVEDERARAAKEKAEKAKAKAAGSH